MSTKLKSLCVGIFLLGGLLSFHKSLAQKVNTVVIDAGHGGKDSGALGATSKEKDIALAVALKLEEYITTYLPDVKVLMTRREDNFVELWKRARYANENKADLFISIHCNSSKSKTPYGVETFVMGLHRSDANLAVAKTENASILLEENYVAKYDGFDPNSPEGTIFFNMMQNSFLTNSLDFAGKVQYQLTSKLNRTNRGVKQAGFLVLYKTAMPGVLVEIGFISNATEEKYLKTVKGQNQIALSLYRAFREYKYAIEKRTAMDLVKDDSDIVNTKTPVSQPVADEPVNSPVVFRVQFALYPDQKPLTSPEFKGLADVWCYFHNGSYKYTTGCTASFDEISRIRSKIVAKGYKDAFIVAFKNDKRITIEEAKKLLSE